MTAPTMDAWRKRFTRRVVSATLLSQLPLLTTSAILAKLAGASPSFATIIALVALVTLNTPLYLRLAEWRDHERRSLARVWLLELPYFAYFAGSVFFALAFAPVALLAALVGGGAATTYAMKALLIVCALVGLYSVFIRRLWAPVASVVVEVRGLDPALEGFTIAQLSDVHCGPYMPRWYLRRLARRASSIGADLCVLTGDMITEGEGYVDDVAELVRHLKAPRGVLAILGNHDYFGTVDGARLALERGGARVLRNQGAEISRAEGGAALYVAGIDDNWTGRDDVAAALAERPAGASCVLLAHDPSLFDAIASRGDVDLVLSGHTHAGQVGVPFVTHRFNLGRIKFSRSIGLSRSRDGRCALFVHPGNGTSGPPVRFGVAPAIAKITLVRARSPQGTTP